MKAVARIIIRLENKYGLGPYGAVPDGAMHENAGCPCETHNHPNWRDDPGLPNIYGLRGLHPKYMWADFKFAFADADQYLAWFYTLASRQALDSNQMLVSVYHSPVTYVSARQALYYHPASTLIEQRRSVVFDTEPAYKDKLKGIACAYANGAV